MPSYRIDVETAIRFRGCLDELGEDVNDGKSYLNGYADLGSGQGLFQIISQPHQQAHTAVTGQLDYVRTHLDTTLSENMRDTFSLYQVTDRDNSGQLEALENYFTAEATMMGEIRDANDISPDTGSAATSFTRHHDPSSRYTDVDASLEGTTTPSEPGGVLDYFSVTYLVRWVISFCGLSDPLEWCGRQLAGDWDGMMRYAGALRNLADGIDDVSLNLRAHVDQLEASWEGNAYAACNVAVYAIANAISDGTGQPLRDLADHYEEAAQLARDTYLSLEPIMSFIVDTATGISLFTSIAKGVRQLADDLGGAIDQAMSIVSGAQSTMDALATKFGNIEGSFADFETIGGESGNDLSLLNDDGVPRIVDQYHNND